MRLVMTLVFLAALVAGAGCTRAEEAGPPDPAKLGELERALRLGSQSERREALDELYALGAAAIPSVTMMLNSPDPEHRRRAIWVLSNTGEEGLRYLIPLARYDRNSEVRYDAVLALANLWNKPQMVIPTLRSALEDEDKWVRVAAIETLRVVGDPTVVAAIEARTRDEDALVRSAAESALEVLSVQ